MEEIYTNIIDILNRAMDNSPGWMGPRGVDLLCPGVILRAERFFEDMVQRENVVIYKIKRWRLQNGRNDAR